MSKVKNIIIFIVIVAVIILLYFFFFKPSTDTGNLISATPVVAVDGVSSGGDSVAKDFLTLLLNVKNIKLDDTIFSDNAFMKLHDSSITLNPDGSEGRPNPFAPLGVDNFATTTLSLPTTTITSPVSTDVVPTTPTTPIISTTPTATNSVVPSVPSSNIYSPAKKP